jgi:biopolymer transport protein TolQ
MPPTALTLLAQLPAPAEPGIVDLFLGSGWMAKFVLGLLATMSVVSWSIMVTKHLQMGRADRQSRRFLEVFRRSERFSEVSAAAERLGASPLVGIFQAGYMEIDSQIKATAGDSGGSYRLKSLDGLHRSLRRAIVVERQVLSRGIGFLATTAAASPFIGLFGTVWGIMIAFRHIGVSGSTSLVTVAPGIAEALVNTAAGLVAAIPALVGYNLFSNRIRAVSLEMEDFILELLNLAERNFT